MYHALCSGDCRRIFWNGEPILLISWWTQITANHIGMAPTKNNHLLLKTTKFWGCLLLLHNIKVNIYSLIHLFSPHPTSIVITGNSHLKSTLLFILTSTLWNSEASWQNVYSWFLSLLVLTPAFRRAAVLQSCLVHRSTRLPFTADTLTFFLPPSFDSDDGRAPACALPRWLSLLLALMDEFPTAAPTKHHNLKGLKTGMYCLSSGGQKSKIKVSSGGWFLLKMLRENLLPWLVVVCWQSLAFPGL